MLNLNDEIKISNKPDENKTQAEQNFYNEKMKNITEGGIYKLVYDLCQSFCRGNDYKVNRYSKQELNDSHQQKYKAFQKSYQKEHETFKNKSNVFQSPNFSYPRPQNIGSFSLACDGKLEPFVFFEMVDPTKFAEDIKNKPEVIANYVKQFANCLKQLLDNSDFVGFLISNGENIKILEQIVTSDFVTKGDEKNQELFRNSNLLFVGSQLVNKYYSYVQPYDDETADYKKMKKEKVCPLILNYLKKSSAISNEALQVLLFKSDVYKIFAECEGIVKIVIDAIKKTDFHNYSFGTSCNSINGLNELLEECEQNQSDNKKDCFYNKHHKEIKDALVDKCAEIFADPEENVKIKLDTLADNGKFFSVYELMSDYLSVDEQKNSETAKKLIDALKKWLDNEKLLLLEFSYQLGYLYRYTMLKLFLLDDDLKKSFANACARTIKYFMDKQRNEYNWNLVRCQEYLDNIKTEQKQFLDKFGITLKNYDCSHESYKTHGKNIAWLSLWIFLFLLCIAAMIEIYIVIPIPILKCMCFLMAIPIFPITSKGTDRVARIIRDRVYNAKLDIYKSQTKDEAENKLSWGMLRFSKVKDCFDLKFNNSEDKNNERNNNLIDD